MKTPQCNDMKPPKGGVLSMLQTTPIKLEPNDCIFLVKNIVIQFAPQLFSTVQSPTRLCIQPCPTVTGANRHQKKYKVNKPKVSSL